MAGAQIAIIVAGFCTGLLVIPARRGSAIWFGVLVLLAGSSGYAYSELDQLTLFLWGSTVGFAVGGISEYVAKRRADNNSATNINRVRLFWSDVRRLGG
jgi:hypothetical protein